jgi:hypothetical protein
VEAQAPVNTYVLDEEGLREFYSGSREFSSWGGFTTRREHHQEIRLPFRGSWYLIVLNPSDSPVAVSYEVLY